MVKKKMPKEEFLRYINSVIDDDVENITIIVDNDEEDKVCRTFEDTVNEIKELGWTGEYEGEADVIMNLIKCGTADDIYKTLDFVNYIMADGEGLKDADWNKAIDKLNHVFNTFSRFMDADYTLQLTKTK